MTAIADHLVEKYGNTPVWVTVLHGHFAEKADLLANEFKQKLNIAIMEMQRISPVLGVHAGPGIVGAAVVPMELMEAELIVKAPLATTQKALFLIQQWGNFRQALPVQAYHDPAITHPRYGWQG